MPSPGLTRTLRLVQHFTASEASTGSSITTVAITGGAGSLGTKLGSVLAGHGFHLVIFDLKPPQKLPKNSTFIRADLSKQSDRWMHSLGKCHIVVHMAAQNPFPEATWRDCCVSIDISCNVMHAAATGKVRRLVLLSSNHVMGRERTRAVSMNEPGATPIAGSAMPSPGTRFAFPNFETDSTPYAVAKVAGERLALSYANAGNFQTVVVRIGWCQPGENKPSTMTITGTPTHKIKEPSGDSEVSKAGVHAADPAKVLSWFRLMWLSNRDFEQVMLKSISCPLKQRITFVNGMSNNKGMRWSMDNEIGFEPADDAGQRVIGN